MPYHHGQHVAYDPRSGPQRFRDTLGRAPSKLTERVRVAQVKPGRLEPAALDHYWHPDRPGVEPCPKDFARELRAVSPDLAVVRPPPGAPLVYRRHAWLVWCRKPSAQHPLCPGWLLLFIWENPDTHEALPLDNRVLANCWMRDPRQYPSGRAYFDTIVKDLAKTQARKDADFGDESYQRQNGLRQYQKIKNIGMGNKFALHHDGAWLPTRGELNWRQDTLYDRLPGEVRATAEKEGKNTRKRVSVSQAVTAKGQLAFENRELHRQLDLVRLQRETRELLGIPRARSMVGSGSR